MDGDSPQPCDIPKPFQKITEMLTDIDKETVDFSMIRWRTYGVAHQIPPNLLINGSSGIAVGMATTNILPHNLSEVCDGIVAYIKTERSLPRN